jgi:hypothetical protein
MLSLFLNGSLVFIIAVQPVSLPAFLCVDHIAVTLCVHLLQLKTTAKTRTYKLVIYQRDLSRKLANEAAAVLQLQTSLGAEWEIEVRSIDRMCLLFIFFLSLAMCSCIRCCIR